MHHFKPFTRVKSSAQLVVALGVCCCSSNPETLFGAPSHAGAGGGSASTGSSGNGDDAAGIIDVGGTIEVGGKTDVGGRSDAGGMTDGSSAAGGTIEAGGKIEVSGRTGAGGRTGAAGRTGAGGEAAGAGGEAADGNSAEGAIGGIDSSAAGSGGEASNTVQILSIDFIGASAAGPQAPLTPLPRMLPAEIAGVKPAAHWNGADGALGSLTGLVLADGSLSVSVVAWNSPAASNQRGIWSVGYVDAPGDVRMMNGYLDPHSTDAPEAPATITVTALPTRVTARGYDVYVYTYGEITASAWSRSYHYSIAEVTITTTQVGRSESAFSSYTAASPDVAGNYVVFRNLSSSAFTLLATPGNATSGAGQRAPVNGIQIVSPSGS